MADFVAVIRRTVDGLSDNSPDMRSRVYEKARGAVRRQLESMKPRPSDEMIDRQMGKLEAAITEVEASHAAAPAVDAVPMPVPVAAAAAVAAPAFAPVDDAPPESALSENAPAEDTAPEETAPEYTQAEAAPAVEDAPAEVAFQQPPVPYDVTHVAPDQPVEAAPIVPEPEDTPYSEPEPVADVAPEPVYEEPADEPAQAADVPAYEPYSEPEPEVYHAPEAYAEPAAEPDADRYQPEAASTPVEDFSYLQEPVSHPEDAAIEPVDENDTVASEEAVEPEPVTDEPEPLEEPAPVEEPVQDWAYLPYSAPEPDAEPASIAPETIEPEQPAHAPVSYEPAPVVEPVAASSDVSAMPSASWDLPEWNEAPIDPVAEPVAEPIVEPAAEQPVAEQPAEQTYELAGDHAATPVTGHIEPVWTEAVETHPAEQAADPHDDWRDETLADAVPVVLPAVSGGLTPEGEPSHSWALDETDPFQQEVRPEGPESVEPAVSDWSWPVDRSNETERTEAGDEPPPPQNWDEIDSLLAAGGAAAAAQTGRSALDPTEAPAAPRRPASYRAEPRKSAFSIKRIVSVLVLLLVFGGGGYAYWMNRDAVNGWVTETIASLNTAPPTASNGGASATGTGGAASGTAASGNATTDVASAEPNTKFTQRLQTDGSEVDEGAAQPPAGESAAQEGKSVAAQTEASRPVDTADASATATPPAAGTQATTPDTAQADPSATTPGIGPETTPETSPETTPGTTPASDAQTPPVSPTGAPDEATTQMPAGAQKMFLYEERLGQTAPTAIEGGVAWSLKEEAPEAGQRPEPVIQAQITVPDRGLTALMTIKRNTDTSLPASHTIEFVFSLPENFEGGSIDSVQRVAMKRNEQDRGDPLIAVPAKITDDFHMIALNDFPEAVTTNLDLMRTRSWIDIPLTYRNGRRALLTLEKGTAGTEAFTKALAAWSQARPAGN